MPLVLFFAYFKGVNSTGNEPTRKRLRVLIADDTAAIRESLSALVKRLEDVEIIGLAEAGRGNQLASIRGTYWSAYNGVSEWLTHNRGRSEDNRLNSLWFGDGAVTNRHALETAIDMAG